MIMPPLRLCWRGFHPLDFLFETLAAQRHPSREETDQRDAYATPPPPARADYSGSGADQPPACRPSRSTGPTPASWIVRISCRSPPESGPRKALAPGAEPAARWGQGCRTFFAGRAGEGWPRSGPHAGSAGRRAPGMAIARRNSPTRDGAVRRGGRRLTPRYGRERLGYSLKNSPPQPASAHECECSMRLL